MSPVTRSLWVGTRNRLPFVFKPNGKALGQRHLISPAQRTDGRHLHWHYVVIPVVLTSIALARWRSSVKADESTPLESQASVRRISAAQLSQHRDVDSVWVAIRDDVWDVTDFVTHHPGGADMIMQHAGTDVTKIFTAIHPPQTIEQHLHSIFQVGRLTDEASAQFRSVVNDEDEAINRARNTLFGVDSVTSLSDFELHAQELLPKTAWNYYTTGADSEHALRENTNAFDRVHFRPRVLRDVTKVDTRATILGVQSSIPVYVSPTARNALGQPLGEIAVTLGARNSGILQVLSHYASKSLDEVMNNTMEGQKVGWQLYMNPDRAQAARDIEKAVALGAHSIWITVDTAILGKREYERRSNAAEKPTPHGTPLTRGPSPKYANHDAGLVWEDISWVRDLAPGVPIVLKGIGAWEDAVMALEHGVDAIVLSNHGGRQLDYANAPLKTLHDLRRNAPEVLKRNDFQVLIDGGVRRGTDVLKALCLGAHGVGLGRPFIYAATAWGSDGVEKAVMILKEEIEIGMKLLGVTKTQDLGPQYLDCSKL